VAADRREGVWVYHRIYPSLPDRGEGCAARHRDGYGELAAVRRG